MPVDHYQLIMLLVVKCQWQMGEHLPTWPQLKRHAEYYGSLAIRGVDPKLARTVKTKEGCDPTTLDVAQFV